MNYIAINKYRSSTSNGFDNTWVVYTVESRAEQRKLLEKGLPVNDCWHMDNSPVYSTNGIRIATPAEIRAAKRDYLVDVEYA